MPNPRLNWCILYSFPALFNFFSHTFIGKESTYNVGDPSLIPGWGRATGEGIGYRLQYSWTSLVAQLVKNPPALRETWVGKIPWRREWLPTPVFLDFPGGSDGKESSCNVEELGSIPRLGRSLEEDMATFSSILVWRIPMDREAWLATVHGSQSVGHD